MLPQITFYPGQEVCKEQLFESENPTILDAILEIIGSIEGPSVVIKITFPNLLELVLEIDIGPYGRDAVNSFTYSIRCDSENGYIVEALKKFKKFLSTDCYVLGNISISFLVSIFAAHHSDNSQGIIDTRARDFCDIFPFVEVVQKFAIYADIFDGFFLDLHTVITGTRMKFGEVEIISNFNDDDDSWELLFNIEKDNMTTKFYINTIADLYKNEFLLTDPIGIVTMFKKLVTLSMRNKMDKDRVISIQVYEMSFLAHYLAPIVMGMSMEEMQSISNDNYFNSVEIKCVPDHIPQLPSSNVPPKMEMMPHPRPPMHGLPRIPEMPAYPRPPMHDLPRIPEMPNNAIVPVIGETNNHNLSNDGERLSLVVHSAGKEPITLKDCPVYNGNSQFRLVDRIKELVSGEIGLASGEIELANWRKNLQIVYYSDTIILHDRQEVHYIYCPTNNERISYVFDKLCGLEEEPKNIIDWFRKTMDSANFGDDRHALSIAQCNTSYIEFTPLFPLALKASYLIFMMLDL